MMGYQECMQFASDFNIRNSSSSGSQLLTNIQCGEIFLNYLSFNSNPNLFSSSSPTQSITLFELNGLAFDKFLQCLLALTAVAYRDYDIDFINKVKALLSHMFQAVSCSDHEVTVKMSQQQSHSDSRNGTLYHSLYDSSHSFRCSFRDLWKHDKLRNYLM